MNMRVAGRLLLATTMTTLAALAPPARAQDAAEPVDEEAAQQLEAIGEAARERVGEAAEVVGEGFRGLFGAARNRVGAAARNAGEAVRAAVTGQPRRREQVVAEMIRIAPAEAAAANEAQVDQMAQQLRPYLRSELYLVREVCKPSKDQLATLRETGDKVLRRVATPFAGNGFIVRSDQPEPGPAEQLQDGLAAEVGAILTPEQRVAYHAEVEARVEARKRVAIDNLVAFVDQKLLLSDAQREALGAKFAAQWDDGWYNALEVLRYGDQYFPALPENCVLPVLDATQKRIWQARMQNHQVIHFGGLNSQPVENEPLELDHQAGGEAAAEPPDGGDDHD